MIKKTFANRLQLLMKYKGINTVELAKIVGVSRQTVSYILNNNLKKSKLALKFALALGVSYEWLANGIEDKSFLDIKEVVLFSDIFDLLKFISTKTTSVTTKSISYNPLIDKDSFSFHSTLDNTYYYCTTKNINSIQYFTIDVETSSFNIDLISKNNFSFPIVEIKKVLV